MRRQIRNITLSVLGNLRRIKPGIHIINAHFVSPSDQESRINDFIAQLEYISKKGKLLRIEDAIQLILNQTEVDKPYVAFSFDDGFLECYEIIAPILEKYSINGAFFINPNFVECNTEYYSLFSKRVTVNGKKPMNWKQIKDLHERGHLIGGHTLDHINLGDSSLKDEDLREQILECKNVIDLKIGSNCQAFAFPYGTFSNMSEKALSVISENYEYIFSGTDFKNYTSFNGQVINRRHIEPFWPISHLKYFLSFIKRK